MSAADAPAASSAGSAALASPETTDTPFGMSAEYGDLVAAMVKVQRVLRAPQRNKRVSVVRPDGERYDFSYASLDVINEMIRKPLARNGLILVHLTHPTKTGPVLLTRVMLRGSHQHMTNSTPIYLENRSPHAWASAVTYAKRHAICTLLNIAAEEDDDGNAAQGNVATASPKPQGRANGEAISLGLRLRPHGDLVDQAAQDDALRGRFSRLITLANQASDAADVAAVLRAWQLDAVAYRAWADQPARADEWELLLRLVPSAIRRVHGAEMSAAWADGVKARTMEELHLLRERWNRDWVAAAARMRTANPAGFELLLEGLRLQTTRIEGAAIRSGDPDPAKTAGTGSSFPEPRSLAGSAASSFGTARAPQQDRPAGTAGHGGAEDAGSQGHALFDEQGDPVSAPYHVPVSYALGYIEQDGFASDTLALRRHNAEGLAWCAADPAAAGLLRSELGGWVLRADDGAAAGDPAPETAPETPQGEADAAAPAPVAERNPAPEQGSVRPPVPLAATARGTPDLGRYLVGVRRSLHEVGTAEALKLWEDVNAPVYRDLPQSTRLNVLGAIAARGQVLGIDRSPSPERGA